MNEHGSADAAAAAIDAERADPGGAADGWSPPAPGELSGMRLPDFFIAGNAKSGTTALYEMLRLHPQIFLPEAKELWFLASELMERTPPTPFPVPGSVEEYLGHFRQARPEQRAGEATAMYLWSQTAAERIARIAPDARIIAIFREPASFLRSLHLQWVQSYVETESDFQRALALEPRRREGLDLPRHTYWPRALLYSELVSYADQLRRYYEHFPREQVKVLIYDDFRADNPGTVREVLRFLEVDDGVTIEAVNSNPTVQPRSQRLHEAVHAVGVGRGPASLAIKRVIKTLTPDRARRAAFYAVQRRFVFSEPEPIDEAFMRELKERHRGQVEQLSELLDRDLIELWGYAPRA